MGLYRTSKIFRELLDSYQLAATHLDLPSFIDIIANPDLDMSTAPPT